MLRVILAVLTILSIASLDAAGAAGKRKKHKVKAIPPTFNAPVAPSSTRTPGPPWAGPGECYTDDGYGRYVLCGAGKE
jgi:hypothetical protein